MYQLVSAVPSHTSTGVAVGVGVGVAVSVAVGVGVVVAAGVAVGVGVGVAAGVAVGVGVGVANSTSSQQVTSITVSVTFKNGDVAYVNFLDNIMAYQGDNRYNVALASAKQFRDKLELLHKYAA